MRQTFCVTRANPNFCAFCGVRNAFISCPTVDPVSADLPFSAFSHPPSKCPDCTQIERTTNVTVVDGIKQTLTSTKMKLCAAHLVPDSAPPSAPDLNLSMSSQSQQILGTLQQIDDPFDLLFHLQLIRPLLTFSLLHLVLPTPPSVAAGPIRRRQRTEQSG